MGYLRKRCWATHESPLLKCDLYGGDSDCWCFCGLYRLIDRCYSPANNPASNSHASTALAVTKWPIAL